MTDAADHSGKAVSRGSRRDGQGLAAHRSSLNEPKWQRHLAMMKHVPIGREERRTARIGTQGPMTGRAVPTAGRQVRSCPRATRGGNTRRCAPKKTVLGRVCPRQVQPDHHHRREGKLSQSEIDRMVQEAQKYRDEDEANESKDEAENRLENVEKFENDDGHKAV